MQKPRFLYFDLGNVLLNFDHHLAARQMAQVAGLTEQRVWDLVFAGNLEARYESGEVGDREFYEIFCRETDSRPDFDALLLAGSEIFTIRGFIRQMRASGAAVVARVKKVSRRRVVIVGTASAAVLAGAMLLVPAKKEKPLAKASAIDTVVTKTMKPTIVSATGPTSTLALYLTPAASSLRRAAARRCLPSSS